MSDKLKDFIDGNRAGFDRFEPGPQLWSGISAGMQQPIQTIKLKKLNNMFKYGFGASALVIGTLVVLNLPHNGSQAAQTTTKRADSNQEFLARETPTLRVASPLTAESKTKTPAKTQAKEEATVKYEAPAPPVPPVPPVEDIDAVAGVPPMPGLPPASQAPPQSIHPAAFPAPLNDDDEWYGNVDTLFKGIKKLKVEGEFCKISITGANTDAVRLKGNSGYYSNVTSFGKKEFHKRKKFRVIRYQVDAGLLRVWIEEDGKRKPGEGEGDSKASEKEESVLNFEVPFATEVVSHNSSGHTSVKGLKGKSADISSDFGNIGISDVTSELKVKSSSGHITLRDIKGNIDSHSDFGNQLLERIYGDVKLNSSSGNLVIRHLNGKVDMKTSFGSQKLDSITGNINSNCSSGNVIVKNLKGNVTAKSSFGRQHFENVEGDIFSSAGSGNIEVTGSRGKLDLKADFGNIIGKDVLLSSSSEFRASSGNIRMSLLNTMKDLRFDLEASSGHINVTKENYNSRSDKKLNMGEGSILIKGTSTFGSQKYN